MTALCLTPRIRRPPGARVTLDGLWLHTEQGHFRVPPGAIHLTPAPVTTPHVVQAVSARLPEAACTLLSLPGWPCELLSTAVWRMTFPGSAPVTVTHVIRWLLPDGPAPVLSDDTWLWHRSSAAPCLCPGDRPVMAVFPSAPLHRGRHSLSVIDCRNRHGIITRRYQTFPLAPLADDCLPSGVPLTPLMPCKENALCLNEFAMPPLPY